MNKIGFKKQDNGVIFTTSIIAYWFAELLVKSGYLTKIFKYCYVIRKKNLI